MSRCIDADALINEFDRTFLGNNPRGVIRATIENAPTIEPERKKGEWIHYDDRDFDYDYKCSECGYAVWDNSDFCPNCGADMRGKEDG